MLTFNQRYWIVIILQSQFMLFFWSASLTDNLKNITPRATAIARGAGMLETPYSHFSFNFLLPGIFIITKKKNSHSNCHPGSLDLQGRRLLWQTAWSKLTVAGASVHSDFSEKWCDGSRAKRVDGFGTTRWQFYLLYDMTEESTKANKPVLWTMKEIEHSRVHQMGTARETGSCKLSCFAVRRV